MSEAAEYRLLLEELFAARRAGVVFGLTRMQDVLARLGNPDRRLGAIVHVGGTNGKGSTVALIAAMARAHGLRVAQYTSPHLATVRERIAFDGRRLDRAGFLAAARQVREAGAAELTFFEQITAIAMVALARLEPELTVLEVGLGGRLDSTNVVDSAVAVVTGVALDHQAMLGDTLELIAVEKAGIFRAGRPAIVGASGEPAAASLLAAHARAIGAAPVHVVDEAEIAAVPEVALRGAHQRRNAAAALAAVRALVEVGVLPDDERARRRGLAEARHPGRFEVIATSPTIVLDGAHNPHGAAALAAAVAGLPRPRVLVLAVSNDKDIASIAGALVPQFSTVIATAYAQDRALAPAALAAAVAAVDDSIEVQLAVDVAAALGQARPRAGAQGSIVVAGSLFLVGEARVLLLGDEADPIRLSDPSALAPTSTSA